MFDYKGNKVCQLYDNQTFVQGQACGIVVQTERNGWKELSFTLPSVDGKSENPRMKFLQSDYRVRFVDGEEVDWFILSEEKVTHTDFRHDVKIKAGHVSQTLKHKNLGLMFSDEEGNNVGTAAELLSCVLDGTGWKPGIVSEFYEKDKKSVKRRSLKAEAKTGAFKLITMICALFEAKPVFRGDAKTVDLLPMNPFSQPKNGDPPDIAKADKVIEIHYGKNLSSVSRTLNTEKLVTKLYAYGAYGDRIGGYCGIDEAQHTEYRVRVMHDVMKGDRRCFDVAGRDGTTLWLNFTAPYTIPYDTVLVYSLLDGTSELYLWDEKQKKAIPVSRGKSGTELDCLIESEEARNWFPYLTDYRYYRENGLLTDEMLEAVAESQRNGAKNLKKVYDASLALSEQRTRLSELIGSVAFAKLDVKTTDLSQPNTTILLNTDRYEDGVIYRTDADKKKKDRFRFSIAESINPDGDSKNKTGCVVLVVTPGNPPKWKKAYLKAVDNEVSPTKLTLWCGTDELIVRPTDDVFLFGSNNINGRLGALESADEAAVKALEESTKTAASNHPVFFSDKKPDLSRVNTFGWWWRYSPVQNSDGSYDPSSLYFCNKEEGDGIWRPVHVIRSEKERSRDDYAYDWQNAKLYDGDRLYDTTKEQRIAAMFGTVLRSCMTRDRLYQGVASFYSHTIQKELPSGNYFIRSPYDAIWCFSTTEKYHEGTKISYNTESGWVNINENKVESSLQAKTYRFDNVGYHAENVLGGLLWESGIIDETGTLRDGAGFRLAGFGPVVPKARYKITNLANVAVIHFYDEKRRWLSSWKAEADTFLCPARAYYIKPVCAKEPKGASISAENRDRQIIIEDEIYSELPSSPSGETRGILNYIGQLAEFAKDVHEGMAKELSDAQKAVSDSDARIGEILGDLLKEGYWQKNDYVDGDEKKLYDDALENLQQSAKPDAKYEIKYLDLRDANRADNSYGTTEAEAEAEWPEPTIESAVHLIDEEIGTNLWAYIDKLQKCYDEPWKTQMTINTNLTLMAQHSFTDALTNIANVVSQMNGKMSVYDNSSVIKTIQTTEVNGKQIVKGSVSGDTLQPNSIRIEHLSGDLTEKIDLLSSKAVNIHVSDIEKTVEEYVGYRVEVLSTSDILSDAISETTLEVRIWKGNKNVTDEIDPKLIRWKRKSSDDVSDQLWNAAHKGLKKFSIGTTDVVYSATYFCELMNA